VTTLMVAMDAARSTGVVAAAVACSCYDTASETECALTGGGGVGVARSIGATMASMVLSRASGGVAINGQFAAGLEVSGGLGFTRGSKGGRGLVDLWNWDERCGGSRLGRELIQGMGGSKTPGSRRLGD
jgi:hypothetical protein